MSGQTVSKQFNFNENIDGGYLFSLYADDYAYLEEVFLTTLRHFDPDVESIKLAYADGNIADLKRGIHKIKPTFGFVGLLAIELACKDFEELCQHTASAEDIAGEYKLIMRQLQDGKEIMETEYKRLKEFNANPL